MHIWCHQHGRKTTIQIVFLFGCVDTFFDYLKLIHSKFSRSHLFMDKASFLYYGSKNVIKYFEEHKDIPILYALLSALSLELW